MQTYDSYKDSGIQWLGEIPSHWEVKRIASLGFFSKGGGFSRNDLVEEDGLPAILYGDIYTKYNIEASKIISKVKYEVEKYSVLAHKGDLLMTGSGETKEDIGKTIVLKTDSYIGGDVIRFSQKGHDSKFLSYFLNSQYAKAYRFREAKGEIIVHIYASALKNMYISLPPFPEQQAIASYLDTATAKIDEAIAQQQRMIDLLNERKQIIINNAVTKGLNPNAKMKPSGIDWIGNIPEHWDTIKIKYLLNEIKDRSATGQEEPLSMSQKYGLIPTKKMDVVPNMASSFVGAKIVGQGDLVFNKLKAHLGVFATSDYEGLVSPDYAVYKGTGLANLKYLEYIFKTPKCIAEFVRLITGVGSGLSRLYTSDLYSIYVPLPSMQEQLMIVEYIDSSTANIKTAITNAEKQITLLQERKQIIINDVVTGKVKVV